MIHPCWENTYHPSTTKTTNNKSKKEETSSSPYSKTYDTMGYDPNLMILAYRARLASMAVTSQQKETQNSSNETQSSETKTQEKPKRNPIVWPPF